MQAIVAVDRGWGIGLNGGMLYDLPQDLKHFARLTRGKVVVMGRGTLMSLPGSQPLKGRVNIVLSRQKDLRIPGAQVVRTRAELAEALAPYAPEDVFLIGGDSVYAQLIDCCTHAVVTRVEATRPADSFFPNLDQRPGWRLAGCEEPLTDGGIQYAFCTYVNQRPQAL